MIPCAFWYISAIAYKWNGRKWGKRNKHIGNKESRVAFRPVGANMHPLPQAAYTNWKKQRKQTWEKAGTKQRRKRGSIHRNANLNVQSTIQSGYKMAGFLKSIFSSLCTSCHIYIYILLHLFDFFLLTLSYFSYIFRMSFPTLTRSPMLKTSRSSSLSGLATGTI